MSLNGEQGTSALFSNSRGRGAGFKRPSRPGSGSFRGAIKSQNRSKVFNSSPSTQIQQSEEEDIQSQDVEDSSLVVTTQDRAARFTASPSENRYLEVLLDPFHSTPLHELNAPHEPPSLVKSPTVFPPGQIHFSRTHARSHKEIHARLGSTTHASLYGYVSRIWKTWTRVPKRTGQVWTVRRRW